MRRVPVLPTDDGLERLCTHAAPAIVWSVVSFKRGKGWHYSIHGNDIGFGYGPPEAGRPLEAAQAVAIRDAVMRAICERYEALRPRHSAQEGDFDLRVYYSAEGEVQDAYFFSASGGSGGGPQRGNDVPGPTVPPGHRP